MPKRFVLFMAVFVCVIGWMITIPFLERATLESQTSNTTPSSSPVGYKALYLLMQQVQDKPVHLWEHSIMRLPVETPQTVWFLEPGPGLFFDGQAYIQRMQELINQGYNFVFVLNNTSLGVNEPTSKGAAKTAFDYLNEWFSLTLAPNTRPLDESQELHVKSDFPTRQIETLALDFPEQGGAVAGQEPSVLEQVGQRINAPSLMLFDSSDITGGKSLLSTEEGYPLAVQYHFGKGSVTILPNSWFLKNGQLEKADNAALAAAIQEEFPEQPILFEVYSSGFNANKDIITYLASGNGIALLITLVLLLGAFCIWLVCQPLRVVHVLKTSDERYFTQEAFISALARHYLATGKWTELYRKLLWHFNNEIEQRFPGYSEEERLQVIAQSPFHAVSLKELEEVFILKNIASEEAFVKKSQHLLEVQRKVCHYEHNTAGVRTHSAASIRR